MEDSSSKPAVPTSTFDCPHCGFAIDVTLTSEPQSTQCPSCQQSVELPPADAPPEGIAIEDDLPPPPPPEEEELDPRHIRRISMSRRAAYRSRSWYLIGMTLLLMGAAKLFIISGTQFVNKGVTTLHVAFAMVGLILCGVAFRAYLKSREAVREVEHTSIPEPDRPPDFSGLSDGSQYSKNLEKMFKEDEK